MMARKSSLGEHTTMDASSSDASAAQQATVAAGVFGIVLDQVTAIDDHVHFTWFNHPVRPVHLTDRWGRKTTRRRAACLTRSTISSDFTTRSPGDRQSSDAPQSGRVSAARNPADRRATGRTGERAAALGRNADRPARVSSAAR